jgi:hypothetical protein
MRLAHHVPRGLLSLVVALGDRAHLLLGELVRERADLLLFAGEREVESHVLGPLA